MARIGGAPQPTITDDRALGVADIQRSLRFNSADSAYLSRTVSTTSNRKTFTFSCWVKRTLISTGSALQIMGSNATSGNNQTAFGFDTNNTIFVRARNGGDGGGATTRQFRDTTSWMHLSYVVDTPQTESQAARTKIYVNGVEESVTYANNHLVNSNLNINLDGTVMQIGALYYSGSNFTNRGEFYLAEVNSIDGYAYDSSYFGFTDSQTGIWMPKRYEGTYGNNGFRLDFSDNSSTAALGIDRSPNGNDFTVNNFSVTAGEGNDSLEDTPTNNFCTMNPLVPSPLVTWANGNLDLAGSSSTEYSQNNTSTFGVSSGKWYVEVKYTNDGTTNTYVGICPIKSPATTNMTGSVTDAAVLRMSNETYIEGSDTQNIFPSGISSGNIIGIALDMDNQKLWFSLQGTYANSGNPATGANAIFSGITAGETMAICARPLSGTLNFNFGQRPFSYTPPSGFKALSSSNLPSNVPSTLRPQKFFDSVIYTGNGSTGQSITSLDFQPDLIWFKSRSHARNNAWNDSVRGRAKVLYGDASLAQVTDDSDKGLISFDTSGFTLGASQNASSHNNNGESLVAWSWKAGGNSNTFNIDGVGYATAAAAGLDGGTATPTGASVNTKSGFSILKYNGTADQSISHGLSKAPEFTVEKELSNSTAWTVTTTGIDGSLDYLYLNQSDAKGNYGVDVPTSSLVDIGRNNECVMYMWHSVPGYSKIGNFMGNGSADGSYVHLGFKPAWIIMKRTSASGNSWGIFDNKRSTSNSNTKSLFSNSTSSEYTTNTAVDFLANGFKLRSNATYMNASGHTYLYMAFAETPDATPFDTFPNAR